MPLMMGVFGCGCLSVFVGTYAWLVSLCGSCSPFLLLPFHHHRFFFSWPAGHYTLFLSFLLSFCASYPAPQPYFWVQKDSACGVQTDRPSALQSMEEAKKN